MSGSAAGPGWHPDIQRPGWLRYWDGSQWTEHWSPVPPQPPAPPPRRPQDAEREAAGRARLAILVYGCTFAVSSFAYTAFAVRLDRLLDDFFDAIDSSDPEAFETTFETTYGTGMTIVSGFSQLLSFVMLLTGIFFVIWLHHASGVARDRGYPQQWSQYWAWLGFLVPVLNFIVPYQVARDTLPPGHPSRSAVATWWAAYVLAGVAMMLAMVSGLLGADALAWTMTVVGAVGWTAFGVLGRQLVDEIGRDHEALTADRSG